MKQSRKNAGMTLVELMMATALAAIVMVPIGTLIVTSLREPMIQQELFFKEASIQESVHLLREKIRNAAITNITLIH
ncbi:MAG: prepilin-type N-terminal cleavage/methylation domain-containing protein, partial [Kiritimatiellaceae bacterium]|nr:prepilin-type N-terminal cleavage/methylation domain-containing protein [Kiritimatiellaceae bacterium]